MASVRRLFLVPLLLLAGCSSTTPTNSNTVFDVPAVLSADFQSAQNTLGKPSDTSLSSGHGAGRDATWEDKAGNTLSVIYDETTKKPAALYLTVPTATPDKLAILTVGNLSPEDTRYSLRFISDAVGSPKYQGVKIQPLNP